jgi:hypothetical protein
VNFCHLSKSCRQIDTYWRRIASVNSIIYRTAEKAVSLFEKPLNKERATYIEHHKNLSQGNVATELFWLKTALFHKMLSISH